MPGDQSNIKGSCVKSVSDFVKERGGEEVWQRVIAGLPPQMHSLFSGLVLSSKWYPLEAYFVLLQEIEKQMGPAHPMLGVEIGKKIIGDGLNSIYRMMMGILNTSWVLSKAPALWKMYFDHETLSIVQVSDGQMQCTIHSPINPPKIYCKTELGGILQALEATGGKNCQGQEVKCRANHDSNCEFHFTWK
ncbi:MAG: hypothetical protein HGA76_02585 [Candidatus Firestonebacteria bacterium]|nr:hypothetical protein [Candidatus Firestonebacteria bacterium]